MLDKKQTWRWKISHVVSILKVYVIVFCYSKTFFNVKMTDI